MNAMGIDIGTTTVSVVMMVTQDGAILGSRTVAHHSFLQGHIDQSKIQDPARLYDVVRRRLRSFLPTSACRAASA